MVDEGEEKSSLNDSKDEYSLFESMISMLFCFFFFFVFVTLSFPDIFKLILLCELVEKNQN